MTDLEAADLVVPVDDQLPGTFWDDSTALRACLHEPIPRIPPVFGYDELGSRLFEEITRLPTYYLTGVEWRLLRRHATSIAGALGAGSLAELGSGSAKKTRVLLEACLALRPTTYLPVDVSREMLVASTTALRADLPQLAVTALWGRYEAGLRWLGAEVEGPLAVSFLGSNLGNFTPGERRALVAELAGQLRPGDCFLFSADLVKPAEVFDRCYNDPAGHSAFARFRLNHLTHLNRRFGADFTVDAFVPRAHYNEIDRVVEGHLYASGDHHVTIPALDVSLDLRNGGSVNVGFSAKFEPSALAAEIAAHGLELTDRWVDPDWAYGIFLARKA